MSSDISSQRPQRPAPTPVKIRSYDFHPPTAAALGGRNAPLFAPPQNDSFQSNGAIDPGSSFGQAIAQVVASPAFRSGGPAVQTQFVDVLGAIDPADAGLVTLIADNPNLAFNHNAAGRTLLDELDALAKQPLNASLAQSGVSTADLLEAVMMETVSPATQIDQSVYGTCTVTSLEYALAARQPAEYARLVAGLAGPAGAAQLQGGGVLDVQPEYYGNHLANDTRSPAEVLFQSAAMDAGDGALDYDASTDLNRPESYGGLTTAQQSDIAARLFNRSYVSWAPAQVNDIINALAILQRLDGRTMPAPIIVDIKVGDLANPGYHALDFLGAAEGQVYFRNPWGAGEFQPMLGLQLVDPRTGIYSMSYLDFVQRVTGMSVPTGA